MRLGGVGQVVEIDECLLVRRKANVGHLVREQWVFGGYDITTKSGFMVPVDTRDANTLLPVIQQYILPGTLIMSDLWAAYNTLQHMGYRNSYTNIINISIFSTNIIYNQDICIFKPDQYTS